MQAILQGCRLQYSVKRHPDADAPRILLLHGWGCDSSSFSFIESALLPHATLITLDFPGHGQSAEPPEPWGVGEYAAQLYALLAQESLLPVQVVAHSFGCRVAIKLAKLHPEAIGKLVITGGAGIKSPVSERSRKRTARFKRYNGLLERLKAFKPMRSAVESMQRALRNRYGSPDYIKLNDNMRKTFVKIISEDLFPLLKDIQSPTLLIWGSADTATPLWMGQAMEKEIPDAGLVVFEGGTHFAFMEQWQRFVLITKRFMLEDHA
ncbi:MAG: alpha/beta hydrolase [Candidatus Limiplasma sp.]|nr:alpha/beta hydrolase [Candidatus Limiplasma sp.]MEA5144804.1 alpha/beta hydrolase [Candidatus Limiplasma sp.]